MRVLCNYFGMSLASLVLVVMIVPTSFAEKPLQEQASQSVLKSITINSQPEKWDPVEHTTRQGRIAGRREETKGSQPMNTHFYAFRGIPYAEPPVGDLRLSDPVPASDTWTGGFLDANFYKSICSQYDFKDKEVLGEEDCLYLNVFTPFLPGETSETQQNLPVFFFIHGGGYLRGGSSSHSPSRLLSANIVLVTLNYRLGALGFLSTGDSTIGGNYGLLDQLIALQWVQQNIADFGGDPNRVTVGGFSAGAVSTHHHMLSPRSKGLFHGAVMMSGSAHCPCTMQKKPKDNAIQFAHHLGCSFVDSTQLKSCIATKSTHQIIAAQSAMVRYEFWPGSFVPTEDSACREKPFLPALMDTLTPTSKVPVMLGTVPNEGLLFAMGVILLSSEPKNATAVYEEAARYTMSAFWPVESEKELMEYTGESFYYSPAARSSLDVLLSEMTQVFTDYFFTLSLWKTSQSLTAAGLPVYTYMMKHREPETPVWVEPLFQGLRNLGVKSSILDTGITHGNDLALLFAPSHVMSSPVDVKVTELLISMWTSFVISGKPQRSSHKEQGMPEWTPHSNNAPFKYYTISNNPSMTAPTQEEKQMLRFWNQTFPLVKSLRDKLCSLTTTTASDDPLITNSVDNYSLMNKVLSSLKLI